jgi:hypothetical protein
MKLAEADRRKLPGLLEELARGVEGLLLSGLTTASESTRRTLDVSFQEASRLRLLRLGSTLRTAGDELGKFLQKREGFSRKRLVFFLTRAWLLSHGLLRALRNDDEKEFDRLLRSPLVGGVPVKQVEVVALGVARKVVPGSFCAFDFRLRCLGKAGPLPAGGRLLWSCLISLKPGTDIQPEALLHLPQKQGFTPHVFLEGKTISITDATLTPDETGGARLTLGEGSKVSTGKEFTRWDRFRAWTPDAALERLRAYRPGPLDLDVELQEEIVLHDWQLGAPSDEDEGQVVYPVTAGRATFHAVVSPGDDGKPLRQALDGLRKQSALPPLFALLHYERCRLVLQPLAIFGPEGMVYLTLSRDKVNMASLLRAMKF